MSNQNKAPISILVVGYMKRNQNMYPHTYDFIANLEYYFNDVIYLSAEVIRAFNTLGVFDEQIRSISKVNTLKDIKKIISNILDYEQNQSRLLKKLRKIKFKNEKYLVITIDEQLFCLANKVFKEKVILLSYDFISVDNPMFLKKGFTYNLQQYIQEQAESAKGLIIQDEQRKRIFEYGLNGKKFTDILYLPVGINDSKFCELSAERRVKEKKAEIHIVQSGYISDERRSLELIESYQLWPNKYKLHLRGFVMDEIYQQLEKFLKMPSINEEMVCIEQIPSILNKFDVGFIGYTEMDLNYKYLQNASGQLVQFLRLGIPVIVYGSNSLIEFVNKHEIGAGIDSMKNLVEAIKNIECNYNRLSENSRRLYEKKFNLRYQFEDYFFDDLKSLAFKENCVIKSDEKNDKSLIRQNYAQKQNNVSNSLLERICFFLFNPLKLNPALKLMIIFRKIIEAIKYIESKIYLKAAKKVAIFGTSITAEKCFQTLNNKNVEVVFFVDNSENKHGKQFKGKEVYPVNYLIAGGNDLIDGVVLASVGRKNEMKEQLKKLKFKKLIIEI